MDEIEKAKETLRAAGYFTSNLWTVYDVKLRYNVEDDIMAQDILNKALTNSHIIEEIYFAIGMVAEDLGFKKLKTE